MTGEMLMGVTDGHSVSNGATICPGDLIKANVRLVMHHRGSSLNIEKDETLLVMSFSAVGQRVSFDVVLRGEHYTSSMGQKAFDVAFSLAAPFVTAVS